MKKNTLQKGQALRSSGQVLLIVILAMTVALTVGLSIASRTITNLKLSQQNAESQKAFQAAESGIERAINNQQTATGTFSTNNATYNAVVRQIGGGNSSLDINNGDTVTQDIGSDLWLSHYPDFTNQISGILTLYWGTASQDNSSTNCSTTAGKSTTPALEVLILSGTDTTNPTLSKYFFDPCSGRQTGSSNTISKKPVAPTGVAYQFKAAIPSSFSNGLIAKVIPLYNSTIVGVTTNSGNIPQQGTAIDSTGKSGETVRKITYYSPYPQIPTEIFSYAILSQ